MSLSAKQYEHEAMQRAKEYILDNLGISLYGNTCYDDLEFFLRF